MNQIVWFVFGLFMSTLVSVVLWFFVYQPAMSEPGVIKGPLDDIVQRLQQDQQETPIMFVRSITGELDDGGASVEGAVKHVYAIDENGGRVDLIGSCDGTTNFILGPELMGYPLMSHNVKPVSIGVKWSTMTVTTNEMTTLLNFEYGSVTNIGTGERIGDCPKGDRMYDVTGGKNLGRVVDLDFEWTVDPNSVVPNGHVVIS